MLKNMTSSILWPDTIRQATIIFQEPSLSITGMQQRTGVS